MTRLAVIGVGSFGKNHVRVVRESSRAELRVVVDADIARAREQAGPDIPATADYRDVIGKVDAAILAVPTIKHAEIGCALLEAGIDVLVEKPIAPTLAEADRLIDAAERNSRILQVGHLERFNPAVIALEQAATLPLFFEIHRMSVFTLRSLDVDVVLDLMIHDLDIVLALARAELKDIRAAGISVLSPKVDIANVRLEFADGCIANLTASRVSTEKVRKLRLFQPRQYVSLDYAKQSAAVFKVGGPEGIAFEQLPVQSAEPLKLQFDAFLTAVETRNSPKLNGRTARHTLEVALAILDKIKEHTSLVEKTLSGWKP
ncbi:MAG: Gfo/Idh/MocA family oxidoreductase [Bryobacteraceae bacterium]